ncbi:MAG: oligosaccharide flippase family protein [Chloroflexaceae bacterium]|nr:oligosaccharide flippase family protein [Chloroflexaceae bacterium]NJO05250.1 oligosaccharide flippase family protein [Chloroflexaceae bacterium]
MSSSRTSFLSVVLPNAAWFTLPTMIQRAFGVLLLPVLTRYLSPTDYGVMAMVGLLATGVAVFADWGYGMGLMRNYFEHEDEERKALLFTIFAAVSLSSAVLFGVAAVVLTFAARWLIADWQQSYLLLLYLQFITSVLNFPNQVIGAYLTVAQRVRAYISRTMLAYIIATVLQLVLLVGFDMGVLAIFIGTLVGAVLSLGWGVLLVRHELRPRFRWQHLREAWAVGWSNLPMQSFQYFTRMGDRWVIQALMSLDALGLYSLAGRVNDASVSFSQALRQAWRPVNMQMLAANTPPAELKQHTSYYLALSVLWVVGLSLFAREVIVLLAAPDFHTAYVVVPFLLVGSLFQSVSAVPHTFLLYHKRLPVTVLAFGPAAAVQVGGALLLVPLIGMVGAALASGLAYLTYTIIITVFALRRPEQRMQMAGGSDLLLLVAGTLVSLVGALPELGGFWEFVLFKALLFAIVTGIIFALYRATLWPALLKLYARLRPVLRRV